MAKPKLALIPAAQGNKLYSVLPADGVGDFSFTRNLTGTRINKDGLIETVTNGISRLNYPLVDGVVSGCPSYLLEPNTTNLVVYSEDFSDASWAKQVGGVASAPLVTSNYAISPDGTQNASRVVFDLNGGTTSSAFSQLQTIITGTTGVDYASSVYMKSNDSNTYDVTFIDVAGSTTIVSVTPQWKRFDLAAALASTNMRIRTRGSEGSSDVTDVLIWGAQVEQGSYATSYIPTSGTIQSRSTDTASGSGNSTVINSTEGVLYFETKGLTDVPINSGYIQLSKSGEASFNNSLVLQHRNNGYLRVYVNGSATADIHFNINIDFTEKHKIAVLYKLNGYKLFINGVEQNLFGTPTQAVFSGLDNLSFDLRGALSWNGSIKEVKIYNTTLTDADLETLTSWTSFTAMANALNYTII